MGSEGTLGSDCYWVGRLSIILGIIGNLEERENGKGRVGRGAKL